MSCRAWPEMPAVISTGRPRREAPGIVTFMDGTAVLGAGTLTNGSATFSTTKLMAGSHTITAVYGGGANFLGSTSGPLIQIVISAQGGPVGQGQTATIGFWHNRNGQALIDSFNGGPTATALGNWLAATFPRLYGSSAGAHDLAGETNAQVAAFFQGLFEVCGQKLDAQVLAVALGVYATTFSLGGTAAGGYGFTVSAAGVGASTFDVGSSGAVFGVANNTTLTVMQILQAANNQAVQGRLYDGNRSLDDLANTVFAGINQAGDLS